jgi:hypothetical protein
MKARVTYPNNTPSYKCDNCGNIFHQHNHFVVYTKYQFCGDCNRHLFDPIVQFRLEELMLEKI